MPKDFSPEQIAKLITEDPDVVGDPVVELPGVEDDFWDPSVAPMEDPTLPKPDPTLNNVSAAAPMPTSPPPPPPPDKKDYLLNKIRRPWSKLQK